MDGDKPIWHSRAPFRGVSVHVHRFEAMAHTPFSVVVLAAGMGTRMKSGLPKVMHKIAGRPMIQHGLATLTGLTPAPACIVVVVGPDMPAVATAVAPWPTAVQTERLGTAHAVNAARDLVPRDGTVLVIYGDTPLIAPATYQRLLDARDEETAVVVMGFRPAKPDGYGRLVVDGGGVLEAIVEHRDATQEQRAIGLCNAGIMAIDGALLFPLIDRIGNGNAKGEYYLTDIVGLARADGLRCTVVEAAVTELIGIDSRGGLAAAEAIVRVANARMAGAIRLVSIERGHDPERFAIMPFGGGGALHAGALDTRLAGVIASGCVGPIRDTIAARRDGAGQNTIPGMLEWFEVADVAALCAPRPLLAISGAGDHIFPYSGVAKVVDVARAAYQARSAGDKIRAVEAPGGHRFNPTLAWPALAELTAA